MFVVVAFFQFKEATCKNSQKNATEANNYSYLASMTATTAVNLSATTNQSFPHSYQQTALSAVNHQNLASLPRGDRRSLVGLGMVPCAPANSSNVASSKQRFGGRRLFSNTRTGSTNESDWRSNILMSENDVQSKIVNRNTFEMRSENHSNPSLKRRTLSGTALRMSQDLVPSGFRLNQRIYIPNYVTVAGSQTNLAGSTGSVPCPTSQQYMCSMYALPTSKVTPQSQNITSLSVISGPAPVTHRPDPTGSEPSTQQVEQHDSSLANRGFTTATSNSLR